MFSIIRAIFNGDLRPDEQIVRRDEAYKVVNKQMESLRQELNTTLQGYQCEQLEKLMNMWCRTEGMYGEETFYHGFAMGVLLATEAYGAMCEWKCD